MRFGYILLLYIAGISFAQAQGFAVSGTVYSTYFKETLPGATVILLRLSDSVQTATSTDQHGNFTFQAVKPSSYSLQLNYIGHKTLSHPIKVVNSAINVGQLQLEESATALKEIEIVGKVPLGEQKGDTTVFNAAAFKVADDASAEDLVTKLPGVTVVDGKVQAQGEEVRQVLVDGKRFFGEDANTALRNLPAEVIENIEVFDKKSDEAEFSGFDDGNRAKTINIVTKKNRRQGQFGKASVGVGPDERYMLGTSVNMFKGDRRLTVNGLMNNINMQDFSVGEAPGGGMRGRRNRGGSGGGSGIAITNTFGLNYSDHWSDKIEVSGNYNYSNTQNENNRFVFRNFIVNDFYRRQDSTSSFNTSINENHQFNFRLDYKIDERNRLLITPRISIQKNESFASSIGQSIFDQDSTNEVYDEALITTTDNISNADSYSYNLNNNLHFSHRFDKPGRTLSLGLNTGYSINDGNTFRITDLVDYIKPNDEPPLNQHIKSGRNGLNWRGNLALGERIGENGRVQAEYSVSNRKEDSERLAYDLEEDEYTLFNSRLSNSFESAYLTQETETRYQYNTEKIQFQVEAQYQIANLRNEQEFPSTYRVNRSFRNVLPSVRFEYRFSKTKNFQIDYRTNTDAPSVTQLQEVVDNTNQLRFRVGNPDLVQAFQNSLNLRYRSFNTETNRVFSFFVTASRTDDYITNTTSSVDLDKEPLLVGFDIKSGAQLTRPINLDGNWSARSFISYGQPLNFIKSNINLTASLGYNKTPGFINSRDYNNTLFFTSSTNYGLGGSLSSNISKEIDFNLSTNARYNVVTNTLNNRPNNNFNQSTQLRGSFQFWRGVVFRTELSHQLNAGLSSGFNTNFTLWNLSLSKKVLKSQKGEISLSVNDVLGQNTSIQRSIDEELVQDVQSTVLQRFAMLTFSYNIRSFGGADMPGERERGNRRQGGQGGGGRNRGDF